MRLMGKVAVVTGGGSGFGEGIVRKFVAEGAKVVLMDRDAGAANRVADSLDGACVAFVGDVSKAAGMQGARDLALSAFGGLHVLVNNAGVGHVPTPLDDIDEATFDRIADVNMRSIYHGARAMVPHFKAQRQGAILNVASTGGCRPART